ncbi:MAG: hypothetical protein HRU29_05095 [Rhizobiales bacterium]|nr:hypothetical protein [Hyphomicrobiales bacterium]NRB13758.1 hypothetical protein [Hyphomicrobiales bacterium]
MTKIFSQIVNLFGISKLFRSGSRQRPKLNISYADLDLTKNLSSTELDLIFAINEDSVIPANNLALKTQSQTIIDLHLEPNDQNMGNARFSHALSSADIVFSPNRKLATMLEKKLQRHIVISRHLTKQASVEKYIDLKKVYHLIEDTQLILFDANICHPFIAKPYDMLKHNLMFLAALLGDLPRHMHVVVTGGIEENNIFDKHKQLFEKHNCQSRIHFYVENLEAIKYPLDYSNIDIALLLSDQENHLPSQYFKYLHEEVPIFATKFADANQLILSADIGKIFDHQNSEIWAKEILELMNLSLVKRDELLEKIKTQKQHLNWQVEADHLMSSIMNVLDGDNSDKLTAAIVDLSDDQITDRAQNIGTLLVEQGFEVSILTPRLPVTLAPVGHNIEYIKVS